MISMKALRGFVGLKALVLAGAALTALPAGATELRVFAAASLTDALDDVLVLCTATTGDTATGIYAGSGTIARQIDQGAPADLYISANPQWMDWLEQRDRIAGATRTDLLGNRLAFVTDTGDTDLLRGEAGRPWAYFAEARIAVADTGSVPAGIYARQALENLGWWEQPDIQAALVQSSSVREALTWVLRGEAGFGIVYASDAKSTPHLKTVLIDQKHHDPIRYPAAVVADNDSPEARRLLACLKGAEASDIFVNFGFSIAER